MDRKSFVLGAVAVVAGLLAYVLLGEEGSTRGEVDAHAAVLAPGGSERAEVRTGAAASGVNAPAAGSGRPERVEVERAAAEADPGEPSLLVVDASGQGIPTAELIGLDETEFLLRREADAEGRISLVGIAGEAQWMELYVAAPGLDCREVWVELDEAGELEFEDSEEGLRVVLEAPLLDFARVKYARRPEVPFGWQLGALYEPQVRACLPWIAQEAMLVDAQAAWTPITSFAAFGRPELFLRAPDGCEFFEQSRHYMASSRLTLNHPAAPPGAIEDSTFIALEVPSRLMHPEHPATWLKFLDEQGAPIVGAEISIAEDWFAHTVGTTDSSGMVPYATWFSRRFGEDSDVSLLVEAPEFDPWRVNFSTGALLEKGTLVFTRANASIPFVLTGARPEAFEVAVGISHGVGFTLGEEPLLWFHSSVEDLAWQRAPASGAVTVEVPAGTGEFCAFVRHVESGVLVGGTCGVLAGQVFAVELPGLGGVRLVDPQPRLDWTVELAIDDDAGPLPRVVRTDDGPVELDASRPEVELPFGEYEVAFDQRRRGGLYVEAPSIKVGPSVQELRLPQSELRVVQGVLRDPFGDVLENHDLRIHVEGWGAQDATTEVDGSFEFRMPPTASTSDVQVQSSDRLLVARAVTSLQWHSEAELDVVLELGLLVIEQEQRGERTEARLAKLVGVTHGVERTIDMRSWAQGGHLAPGDYELRVVGSDAPSVQVRIAAGVRGHAVVDMADIAQVRVGLRSSLALMARVSLVELATGAAAQGISTSVRGEGVERVALQAKRGEYLLRVSCSGIQAADLGVTFEMTREVTLTADANFELDLDEGLRAELERLLPERPELADVLAELE